LKLRGVIVFDETQNFKKIVDSEEKTDVDIALELIKFFNTIEDSVLVKFKKKAKKKIVKRASMARESMTNPLAIRLLDMANIINLNDRR
jgi:hypothetical protein